MRDCEADDLSRNPVRCWQRQTETVEPNYPKRGNTSVVGEWGVHCGQAGCGRAVASHTRPLKVPSLSGAATAVNTVDRRKPYEQSVKRKRSTVPSTGLAGFLPRLRHISTWPRQVFSAPS